MATNNSVNTGLSGVTGSGNFVGSTSPVFTTPTVGVATATSLTWNDTTKGVIGTTSDNNAAAGYVGEIISSVVVLANAVSLSSTVAKEITHITVTAGDWDVGAEIFLTGNSSTTVSLIQSGINSITAALPGLSESTSRMQIPFAPAITISASGNPTFVAGQCRVVASGSTAVYLNITATFGTSTLAAYGKIWARRAR